MRLILLCVMIVVYSFAQEAGLTCLELYKLDIQFDEKKNTPVLFKFSHNGKTAADSIKTLSPILKAINYDGFVQFNAQTGIRMSHISYFDPGEEDSKKITPNDVVPVNLLTGKTDSVAYDDMWGSGNLFSQRFLFTEKMLEVRFLFPLIIEKKGSYILLGYACSNWHKLREVEDPSKCYEEKKKRKKKNTQNHMNRTQNFPGSISPKLLDAIDAISECE